MREAIISFPMFGEGFSINPPYSLNTLLEKLGKPAVSFDIYFYGVIIAIGFLLALLYTAKVCRRFDITMDTVYDYVIWAVLAGVVCARLYYCVTYVDDTGVHTYLKDPASILRIRDGGLAIYGAVIGAVAAVLIRARMRRESPWAFFDVMGFGLLIGQLVGRWGNFFNREAYGYETDIFCRMGLTLNGSTTYVHPTFLYESLWNFIGLILLHFHAKKHRKYKGQYCISDLVRLRPRPHRGTSQRQPVARSQRHPHLPAARRRHRGAGPCRMDRQRPPRRGREASPAGPAT